MSVTARPAPPATAVPVVAFVGNPNTGKSTLFNALSGARERVGNFPGCTVEKKTGSMTLDGKPCQLIDLPGTYSLAPRSLDEMVTVEVLLGRRGEVPPPTALICIVDASNLERNLYLVSQALEVGLPTVLAMNMADVAQTRGVKIDVAALSERLGVPVVPMSAHRKVGLDALKTALSKALSDPPPAKRPSPFSEAFQGEVSALQGKLAAAGVDWPTFLAERWLLDTSGYFQERLAQEQAGAAPLSESVRNELAADVQAARDRLKAAGTPVPAVEAMARYAWAGRTLAGVVERPAQRPVTWTDKLDAVLTHRFAGSLLLALAMLAVFQGVFYSAEIPKGWIEAGIEGLSEYARARIPEGAFQSLVVDGIVAGVGGVLPFVPQIMFLFFFVGVLEDCGYLARAAYLMDRLMSKVGLNGKSFIPLLSSFACAIPGIMAARVVENRRDRLTTILVAPLMSCSARVPVYNLMIAAFIPAIYLGGVLDVRALTMFSMYLLGILAAVFVAFLLKKTILKGETPPFVMELPSYKMPSARLVLWRMLESGLHFLYRAGPVIAAVSVVVWALTYYPRLPDEVAKGMDEAKAEQVQLEQSYMGRMGKWIEPAVIPLGWDWKIGSAAIASFPAREVVVGVLGVIYGQGAEGQGEDDEQKETSLQKAIQAAEWDPSGPRAGQKVFNIPVALSLMVFFSLCAQCSSTLVVIRKETNSWFWPAFTFVYMTVLAYVCAFVVYQVGMLFIR